MKNFRASTTKLVNIMHGEENHTAQPRSARYISDNIGSKSKTFVTIPNSGHLLPFNEQRDLVFDLVTDFLRN